MKISAKNVLKGTVQAITPGAVNAEVQILLPGGAVITAIVTKGSVEELGLKVGRPAYVVIKASSVLVGVD